MKGFALSLVLGMTVVFVLLIGYWIRTPYAISAQWDSSVVHPLEPEEMMQQPVVR